MRGVGGGAEEDDVAGWGVLGWAFAFGRRRTLEGFRGGGVEARGRPWGGPDQEGTAWGAPKEWHWSSSSLSVATGVFLSAMEKFWPGIQRRKA